MNETATTTNNTPTEVRTTDHWLLLWCGIVAAELAFLFTLSGSPLWLLLGVVLYWPVRDGLRGATIRDGDPEPEAGEIADNSNTTSNTPQVKE